MPDSMITQAVSGAPWVGTDCLPIGRPGLAAPRKLTIAELFTAPIFTGNVGIGGAPGELLDVSGTGTAPILRVRSSTVGSTNQAAFTASRGDQANGYAQFNVSTLATTLWQIGVRAGTNDLTVFDPVANAIRVRVNGSGDVGIGMTPTVQFELSGSVGQKASGTTWSNPSDARVKENIAPADLDRCYEIVKAIPLKRYTLKREAFSDERARDRSKLGWIAQEVQPLFAKAVKAHAFQMEAVPDGFEEIEEPVVEDASPVEETYIEIVDGLPVQKTRLVQKAAPAVDMVPVTDEQGNPVMEEVEEPVDELEGGAQRLDGAGRPLTRIVIRPVLYPVPRTRKVQKPKFRQDAIPDCLALDADQIYAAMYGALQRVIAKVEALEAQLARK
jgi:endosialidase-like protein